MRAQVGPESVAEIVVGEVPDKAAELLITDDAETRQRLAEEVLGLNKERKKLGDAAWKKIRTYAIQMKKGLLRPTKLAITRKISRAPNSYKSNTRSAVAAKQLQRRGIDLHPGQQIEYVITDAEADNPNLRVTPLRLLERKKYDRDWYVNKLISALKEILNPFDYPEEKIRNKLLPEGEQKKLPGVLK